MALVASARSARADDKPWAKGVSEQNQSAALKLYREGNDDFVEDHFAAALAKYEAALALWSHPAIHYNAAICFNSLDRPLEAFEHFQAAIAYGADPIGKDHFATAKQLLAALAPRVTELEIVCKGPCADRDAELFLDNAKLDRAPSSIRRVLVGKHLIVVSKPAYLTDRKSIDVAPGPKTTVVVELKLIPAAKHLARRWRPWIPWTVFASGFVIAGIGGGVLAQAWAEASRYEQSRDSYCATHVPCFDPLPSSVTQHLSRMNFENNVAGTMFAVGGAAAAIGVYMVIANQPRLVAPDIGRDHVAITISGRW